HVGGVANVPLWTGVGELSAFDTGPGNGMIDLLVQDRGAGRFDDKGNYASVGLVDEGVLRALLAHPYFDAPPPKSLDRYDFSLEPLAELKLEDAAATLVAFTAEAVRLGFDKLAAAPAQVIVTGGGRHNPEIMRALRERLSAEVVSAEDVDWRG
ncbi:MAG TPA: anhydro-N-acetylmuramic acid kinase, partial [Phenylobacterium sp.]|nr:anhydro-N-acetylmuramic acid kinase [Phenylobacterium sp.]